MPETDPVNFSMGAARQIRESVRVTQRLAQSQRGRERRWPLPEDGFGGFQRVFFEVASYNPASGIAVCDITYRPFGIGEVSDEVAGQIDVYDYCGYFTDEDQYDVAGRCGNADYMWYQLPDGPGTMIGRWICSGLMCPS